MLGRVLPTLMVTLGSYVAGRVLTSLMKKAEESSVSSKEKEKSAPKDLGTLDYDSETDSYRPKP